MTPPPPAAAPPSLPPCCVSRLLASRRKNQEETILFASAVCLTAPLHSYGGDPHHHLAVGGGADPRVVGPQLAQDVQDGVAAVVVENSPEPATVLPAHSAAGAAAAR